MMEGPFFIIFPFEAFKNVNVNFHHNYQNRTKTYIIGLTEIVSEIEKGSIFVG